MTKTHVLGLTIEMVQDLYAYYGITPEWIGKELTKALGEQVITKITDQNIGDLDISVRFKPSSNLSKFKLLITKLNGVALYRSDSYENLYNTAKSEICVGECDVPDPTKIINSIAPVLNKENDKLVEQGEIEYIPVIKKATVTHIQKIRCLCMESGQSCCGHCGHLQSGHNRRCVACGQPRVLWGKE